MLQQVKATTTWSIFFYLYKLFKRNKRQRQWIRLDLQIGLHSKSIIMIILDQIFKPLFATNYNILKFSQKYLCIKTIRITSDWRLKTQQRKRKCLILLFKLYKFCLLYRNFLLRLLWVLLYLSQSLSSSSLCLSSQDKVQWNCKMCNIWVFYSLNLSVCPLFFF